MENQDIKLKIMIYALGFIIVFLFLMYCRLSTLAQEVKHTSDELSAIVGYNIRHNQERYQALTESLRINK